MLQKNIYIKNIDEIFSLTDKLVKKLAKGDVITLKGNLGAGKTTFVKSLIKHVVGNEIEVTSPTFNLVHLYSSILGNIWHFDLYRLKNIYEVYELGIEEAFLDGISFIEWPEIIASILPNDRLEIEFNFTNDENSRIISFSSNSYKWQNFIDQQL